MKNVLLLNQANYKSKWFNNFELSELDELICQVKPRHYFDNEVFIVLRNNNNGKIFEMNNSNWNNKHFIKSHLQKCVRRRKKKLAISSALEHIRLDPNDFIRRLSIIMVEDSDIMSFLPTIIWFMIAVSKKYKLTITDVEWLLGCVKKITKCKSKFNYSCLTEPKTLISNDNVFNNSLLLRINYGGMKGDMSMLKKAVGVIEDYHIIKKKVKPEKIDGILLKLEDTLPVGMDFHVSHHIIYDILNLCKSKNIYLEISTIKKWMWETRSGINYRINSDDKENNLLKRYHKEVDIICKNRIKSYFKN